MNKYVHNNIQKKLEVYSLNTKNNQHRYTGFMTTRF